MLDTLRRIIQLVNSAPDLNHALEIIFLHVAGTEGVDVTSVYLKDAERMQ